MTLLSKWKYAGGVLFVVLALLLVRGYGPFSRGKIENSIVKDGKPAGNVQMAAAVLKAAPEGPLERREVKEYIFALEKLQQSKSMQSIEPVFTQAQAAAESLSKVIETLSETDFERVTKNMKGIVSSRIEVVYVLPDRSFFLHLAEEKGLKPDKRFFALYVKTRPDSRIPSYLQLTTDYSACTKYGKNILVNLYEDWNLYREEFPGAYNRQTEAVIKDIVSELAEGTCACGDKESVLSEFQAFTKAYPTSPVSESLSKRIKTIKESGGDMRFNCTPE